MRKAATRSLKSSVAKDSTWTILKEGGIRGRRSTATNGKILRSVGNLGLARGERAVLTSKDGAYGVSVRVLERVEPLLSHDAIAEAMEDFSRGAEVQSVSRKLTHTDIASVKALIKAWHDEWNVTPPAAYSHEDVATLSEAAVNRVGKKCTDFLMVPFICTTVWGEAVCGCDWVGRTFTSGEELQKAFQTHLGEGSTIPQQRLATYNMLIAPRDEWMNATDLGHSLASQQVTPVAVICIHSTPNLSVHIDAVTRGARDRDWSAFLAQYGSEDTHRYRAVLGAEPEADIHREGFMRPDTTEGVKEGDVEDTSCSAATVILVVAKDLLESVEVPSVSANPAHVGERRISGLFANLPASLSGITYPASLLQKAVRRGATLCGPGPILSSLKTLTEGGVHHLAELQYQSVTGTRVALWKVFVMALEDVSPYHPQDEGCLSLPELVALTFLAHVETKFRLTSDLKRRLATTALRLQACEQSCSLWPWKGWKWRKSTTLERALRMEKRDDANRIVGVRNSIRVAMMGLPVTRGERIILMKYLGGLDDKGVWARAVPFLPPCAAERGMDAADPLAPPADDLNILHNRYAELAAFDCQIRPTLLLFLQACLTNVPTDTMQHSLRALAEAIWSLSSGVNVRALKQKLSGAAQETYRFLSFVTDTPGAVPDVTPEKLGIYSQRDGPNETDIAAAKWETVRDGQRLTKHELQLLNTIQQLQHRLYEKYLGGYSAPAALEPLCADPLQDTELYRGRRPTPFEGRTAFLQLFARRETIVAVSSEGKNVSCTVTLAGTEESPFLVQRVAGSDSGDQTGRGGLKDKVLQENAEGKMVAILVKGVKVVPPVPPMGFAWQWEAEGTAKDTVTVSVVETEGVLQYYVEGSEVDPFNCAHLLASCNEPARKFDLPQKLSELVGSALYTPFNTHPDPPRMFEELDAYAEHFRATENMTRNDVYEWHHIAQRSRLPKAVWRDMAIKIATREGDHVEVSKCSRDGTKTGPALQQLTEGVLLRVLYTLQALYPHVLIRTGELRFSLVQKGAQFVHLQRAVSLLAFGSFDDGEGFHTEIGSDEMDDDDSLFSFEDREEIPHVQEAAAVAVDNTMEVTTALWEHQNEAVSRVVEGINMGKRGFADASAVGAGKTLTAVACCVEVSKWMHERSLRRHGFLVIVPNNDLIGEWIQQALLHTKGLHVVAQQHNGYLISRGVSNAGEKPGAHPSTRRASKIPKIDANTIVVSTLGRLRDKPFVGQAGWDLVVIDECLSVQNDSALQTAEAWRQVAASRCGVLMLSATLFRSRISKLFYMIRMLRSALPRTEAYLPALLAEHIICYLPKRVRSWRLNFVPVALTEQAMNVYESRLTAASRAQKDARLVYGELKTVLRELWEPTELLAAAQAERSKLEAAGHTVLVFANSERELDSLKKSLPGARTWSAGKASAPKESGPLVVTTQRGAHGLNLQREADSIICRPQPGDLIEQMKGRVDRPGQAKKELVLSVLYAQNTVEEVEAANIRLCGAFFRQYIDPLSRLFQERAIEASLCAKRHVEPRRGAQGGKSDQISGAVAAAFHQQLDTDVAEVKDTTTVKRTREDDETSSPPSQRRKVDSSQSQSQASATSPPKRKALTKAEREAEKKRKIAAIAEAERIAAEEEAALPVVPTRMTNESAVQALEWLTQRDPNLATVIAAVGPPTEMISELGNDPAIKSLVRSIIFQQISTKAASSITAKLMTTLGGDITVESLQAADDATLRSAGLSARKVSYVRNICDKFSSGEMSDEFFENMPDKQVLETLCSVKGMGEWSSHMFMMFKLGRHDILPVGDIAVRQAFQKLYGLTPHDEKSETQVQYLPSSSEMQEIAKRWRPYRTIGTWYMWHVVETKDAAYTYGS